MPNGGAGDELRSADPVDTRWTGDLNRGGSALTVFPGRAVEVG
jgi:hypothetical protein